MVAAQHCEHTKCHCIVHSKMVNFKLCEFHLNKKKLKYLENSKYLLGIKYVIAQIKHSVDSVPIICCLLSDPTLLPALLISVTENTFVVLWLHQSFTNAR